MMDMIASDNSMFSAVEMIKIGGGAAFLVSLGLGVILTSWMIRLSWRFGAVDKPDGLLKRHGRATATLGGVPLFVAMTASIAIVIALLNAFGRFEKMEFTPFWGALLVSAMIILGLGISDDLHRVRPRTKFLFQTIAATVLIGSGLIVERCWFFDVFDISLGVIGVPFTVFWIVGSCNAFNFIDGMDGLASGIGAVSAVFLAILGFATGAYGAAIVALALAGALLAILIFNVKPASIFLGDSGSQLVGLMLGVIALKVAGTDGVLMLAAAGTILSIPILDALLAILRRFSLSESPAYGDHRHIHHCLRNHGFSVTRTAALLWLAAAVAGAMGILFYYGTGVSVGIAALAFVALELYLGIRLGCLDITELFSRLKFRRDWAPELAIAADVRSKSRLDTLWDQMKPMFEKMKLDRAVLTLEGVNENGQTDFETYMWVRSEKLMADILLNRWTKRFSLDDKQQRMATLRLEAAQQSLRDEQRIEWLLSQIRSNMRYTNKNKADAERIEKFVESV
jgi:UDP-GlcNAc:undecaprenyl-phosphate/decaprenyl-phosphate GlcNAc-1-phosphate transferase